MTRKPSPLYTLLFYQMRLSFMAGAMPLLILIAVLSNGLLCLPMVIVGVLLGLDIKEIWLRKSGRVCASKLIYDEQYEEDYLQIIRSVPGVLLLWAAVIAICFLFVKDQALNGEPVIELLKPLNVLVSNIISFVTFRWLQEVGGMITEYQAQKKSGIVSLPPPSSVAGMRPFSSATASAPPVPRSVGIGARNMAQP